jgi:hypothetical protein
MGVGQSCRFAQISFYPRIDMDKLQLLVSNSGIDAAAQFGISTLKRRERRAPARNQTATWFLEQL